MVTIQDSNSQYAANAGTEGFWKKAEKGSANNNLEACIAAEVLPLG